MGESILGFFLKVIFSPYDNEENAELLKKVMKGNNDPEIIERLANNFDVKRDMMERVVKEVQESYKRAKSNNIDID